MKKTIIAAAVAAAVAAPAAFADIKISGMVNPELMDADVSTGRAMSVNTDLVITGSEDLGNGMKASFKYHLTNDDGATLGSADQTVGLAGDFGSLNIGFQETKNQAYFHPKADLDASHDITLEDATGQQSRASGVIYTSPSFNGLTVGASVFMGDAQLSNTSSTPSNTANASGTDTNDNDITEIFAIYSNGPLTVAAGQTNHKAGSGSFDDEKVRNIYASYTMGDLTVAVLDRAVKNDGGSTAATADVDTTTVSAKYTMGSNAISVGVTDSDNAQDGDYVVSLSHAMSKQTSVYVAYKHDDTPATGYDNQSLVGIKHTF
jgi:predicted porin